MKLNKIQKVNEEMERLKTALVVLSIDGHKWPGDAEYQGDKNTAAVRRASMDLTRALADLRSNR